MYLVLDFVIHFKMNQEPSFEPRIGRDFRRGFLTDIKLSPDCPLVEVLKQPKDDR